MPRPFAALSRLLSSATPPRRPRKTLATIRDLYKTSTPITVLTAYDYPTALHADRAGVDITLVGDSLGMVCLGHRTTQSVTVDHIIHHARAVRTGTHSALLVADMPFGSYETAPDQAVRTAVRLVKEASVDAVKLEGGHGLRAVAVAAVVDAGVAVMGHVGLLPQAVSREGAFRAAGRSACAARAIVDDAIALERAGAFAIVVECVPERVARVVTEAVGVPTIGIGSGVGCDGQVLVYHDMLGILSHPHHHSVAPRFSKQFAKLGPVIHDAISEYCQQVRRREFPDTQFAPYQISDEEFELVESYAQQMKAEQSAEQVDARVRRRPGAVPGSDEDPVRLY